MCAPSSPAAVSDKRHLVGGALCTKVPRSNCNAMWPCERVHLSLYSRPCLHGTPSAESGKFNVFNMFHATCATASLTQPWPQSASQANFLLWPSPAFPVVSSSLKTVPHCPWAAKNLLCLDMQCSSFVTWKTLSGMTSGPPSVEVILDTLWASEILDSLPVLQSSQRTWPLLYHYHWHSYPSLRLA